MKRLLIIIGMASIYCNANVAPLRVTNVALSPKDCQGIPATSMIQFTLAGGTKPYFVVFQGSGTLNAITQETFEIFGVEESVKEITLLDNGMPQQAARLFVSVGSQGSPFENAAVTTSISCSENHAQITYNVIPDEDFDIVRLTDPQGVTQEKEKSSGIFTDLQVVGEYSLELIPIDSPEQECNEPIVIRFTLPVVNPVAITSTKTTPEASAGGGSITISVKNGTPPYTYSVQGFGDRTSNNTTQTFNAISAGTYLVLVTDADNCQDTTFATVNFFNNPITNYIATNEKYCSPRMTVALSGKPVRSTL